MNEINWDKFFLRIAREVAKNSKCMSRQIGAVLVKDKSIISTGYNGPARGVRHCNERYMETFKRLDNQESSESISTNHPKADNCPRRIFGYKSGQGLHLCQAGHAERNAIINAARNGISTYGTTLYCYCPQVCKDCAIEIVNSGIKELVYLDGEAYDNYADIILKEGGILIRTIRTEEV